jgi:hypothetical protein
MVLSAYAQQGTINEMLHVISALDTRKSMVGNEKEFATLLRWLTTTTQEVKQATDIDYTSIVTPHTQKDSFLAYNYNARKQNIHLYTSNLAYHGMRDTKRDLTAFHSVKNAFLVIIGDCDIQEVGNSVIFCTGNATIHSSNGSILIANGALNLDRTTASLLYTREKIKVTDATLTTFLFSRHIHVGRMLRGALIGVKKHTIQSHDEKSYQSLTLKEDYKKIDLYYPKGVQANDQPKEITLSLNYNFSAISSDPKKVAKYYCAGLKNGDFKYAEFFVNSSEVAQFKKFIDVISKSSKKEQQRREKMLKGWSCEVKNLEYGADKKVAIATVDGMQKIKLVHTILGWKVSQ